MAAASDLGKETELIRDGRFGLRQVGPGEPGPAAAGLLNDTIAAIATPPGAGGIGIVRISGPEAFSIARALFRVGDAPPDMRKRGLHLGWVSDPRTGERLDEAVLLVFPAPRSYTTEDVAEIQGHGGTAVVGRVLAAVLHSGARLAAPGEFTKRAFLGGRLDLAQAEAVADLVAARGERALEAAVAQLDGRLSSAVEAARTGCLELMAKMEAILDFPDDVDDPGPARMVAAISAVQEAVRGLLDTAPLGHVAREGATLAIVGRPNVGKSSLLNALLRSDRAIVTAQPGTTRDVVEEALELGGLPFRILDTAGIREAKGEAESLGVARSLRTMREADLRLVVLDASVPPSDADAALLASTRDRPRVVVCNKADLPAKAEPPAGAIRISAKTGEGLIGLEAAIVASIVGNPVQGPPGVAINARHRVALERAGVALERAGSAIALGVTLDAVAIDLREAAQALGQVIGADLTEAMLDVLFSRFCIGK